METTHTHTHTHTQTVYHELMDRKCIKKFMGNEVGMAYNERSENGAIGWSVKVTRTKMEIYLGGLHQDVGTMTLSLQNLVSGFGSYH